MATLRGWAQTGPNAVEGIAHAVIAFARQVLTPEKCGETVTNVLRQMEAVTFGQALDAHPAPAGAHPVRPTTGPCGMDLQRAADELSITVWDTSPRTPVTRKSDPTGIGGHGMRMVHMVSHSVDVTWRASGKHITACLRPAPNRGSAV
ncbi:ATP-binding protein [Streptomyces coeruleorubidus]|uniref:ATP-binding protein n=1 Tax=Streptomyces coeruleorubidus TaxID=116188 RepID=UPI00369A80B7